jgi:methyl-galactoside transport system substrate-binding protein
MRQALIALTLAAVFIAIPAAAQPVVGLEIYREDDTFMSLVREAMERAAEGRASLEITFAENNQSIQNSGISRHLDLGVDVLAVNSVDAAASRHILEKAEACGIPVVFFNNEPDPANMPCEGWYYVGARAEQSGLMAGELMADYFRANPIADGNGDGAIQCVILKGRIGDLDAELRTEYCVKALREAGFDVDIMAVETANWQRSEAREVMSEWLTSYTGIEAVFANNDDMALGAIDALKAAGYFTLGRFIPVVGVDATAQAVEAMGEGTLVGTVLNDAVNIGRATLNLALALANDLPVTEETVGYPVTGGRYVWIPYAKVTGASLPPAD